MFLWATRNYVVIFVLFCCLTLCDLRVSFAFPVSHSCLSVMNVVVLEGMCTRRMWYFPSFRFPLFAFQLILRSFSCLHFVLLFFGFIFPWPFLAQVLLRLGERETYAWACCIVIQCTVKSTLTLQSPAIYGCLSLAVSWRMWPVCF
jgi:hypothetical protein